MAQIGNLGTTKHHRRVPGYGYDVKTMDQRLDALRKVPTPNVPDKLGNTPYVVTEFQLPCSAKTFVEYFVSVPPTELGAKTACKVESFENLNELWGSKGGRRLLRLKGGLELLEELTHVGERRVDVVSFNFSRATVFRYCHASITLKEDERDGQPVLNGRWTHRIAPAGWFGTVFAWGLKRGLRSYHNASIDHWQTVFRNTASSDPVNQVPDTFKD